MRSLIFIFTFLLVSTYLFAQNTIRDINFSYRYTPNYEIEVTQKAYKKPDFVQLDLKLLINKAGATKDDYTFSYYTTTSVQAEFKAVPLIHVDTINHVEIKGGHMLHLSFPKEIDGEIIVTEILSRISGKSYFYYSRPAADVSYSNLLANNSLNDWLANGIYNISASNTLYAYYYDQDFPIARPPMPVSTDTPEMTMTYKSVDKIDTNQLVLGEKGLYLIQKDTTSSTGLSFRVEDKYYPKLVRLEDLITPLRYITTKEEYESLSRVDGDKKKFDAFWLRLTNSKDRAKLIIKKFYDRVESANYFFTSYKEGWKTDMGMIYIIYGAPDAVEVADDGETWIYNASPQLPKLEYKFLNADNIFSDKNFVLIREKKHAANWYRAIDLWRKGRF
ncbi:GWxTD domain-containing protein [Fulvivirga ligni]|uniref:GWxTD domain-containing protein n=1 Tax=Fulvivirga ligni TaxID=2904246 RepID=UPI001F42A400|nr:GWxTD domain-containing protein [Fulvivirga ligni]UII21839.1 GWxTD domain-containing protein [Fulvivirga ligni]